MTVNVTGQDEHVPAIERAIRKIKERIRAIVNQLPFKAYLHRLIVEMVYIVVFWLNVFPHTDGVNEVMSPCTIITGLHISHDKHCALEFGSYAQIHEEHDNSSMYIRCYSPTTNGQYTGVTLFPKHKLWQACHMEQLDGPTYAE